tara:strand:+ start:2280 stop:3185 length:906 start_codon:yes stop_codon:yes gene_type:complete
MSDSLGMRGIRQTRPSNPNVNKSLLQQSNPRPLTTQQTRVKNMETKIKGGAFTMTPQAYSIMKSKYADGDYANLKSGEQEDIRDELNKQAPLQQAVADPSGGSEVLGGDMTLGGDEVIGGAENKIMKAVHKVLAKRKNHQQFLSGAVAENPEHYSKMLGKGFAKSVYRRHIYPSLNNGKSYAYNLSSKKGKKEFEEDTHLGLIDRLILSGLKMGHKHIKKMIAKRKAEKRGGSFMLTDEGGNHDGLLNDNIMNDVLGAGWDREHPKLSDKPNWYAGRGRGRAKKVFKAIGKTALAVAPLLL